MKKKITFLIIYFFSFLSIAQDFSAQWEGHFSYQNIKEVVKGNNKIYAAADNAVFSLDLQTEDIEEFNTVNGLSGETISTIFYSEVYELLVIGYENGLIEIAFDNGDQVLSVVDILEKSNIPPRDKKINHFNPYQNIIYISTNYGISVFDLEKLEFGDTYFIGNNGGQIQVNQTVVFNNNIYAACSNGNGIRKAQISNPNLIDFQNWQTVFTGSYLFIEAQETNLYTINANKRIYNITNGALNELFFYNDIPLDIKSNNQHLIVTTKTNIFIYDGNFNLVSQINVTPDFNTDYTSAISDANNVYIGTTDYGVLKTNLSNPILFNEIHPEGPLMNIPFSLEAEPTGVWVTYGTYGTDYNPYTKKLKLGFSHLNDQTWINTLYGDNFDATNLNGIKINPLKTSQVFINSFLGGLLEINDDIPTIIYDNSNSGLESIFTNSIDIRVGASAFDSQGLLWTLTSRIDAPLKLYNPASNQWKSYSFTDIIPNGLDDNLAFTCIDTSDDIFKWIGSTNFGIIGFSENNGNPLLKNIMGEDKNMPSNNVTATALDNRNHLWIGTDHGLRVLYNTSNFFDENDFGVEEIIIEEDGIAKELLFQQLITDIVVDGSNNKWVGTADSGLFYFSSDGQNTIHHFTKSNSPLPSNTINDLSLDDKNGVLYIATSRGLVSFLSGGSNPFEDLTSAYAYPNPVRPGFNIVDEKVKIKDISENVNIKITDIEGNLVAEAQSRVNQRYRGYNLEIDGGTAYWNGKNLANNMVASGVYLIMLSDLDTFETNVIKLMVVR